MSTQLPAYEVQALSFVRQRNSNGSDTRVLHDALVQLDLVFRDEADGDVSVQEIRVARPALEDDQRIAVFSRHAGDVTGRRDGFSKVNDECDFFSIGNAQAQVVIKDIQDRVRVARQAALGEVGAMEAVIAFQRAAK